MILLHIETSTTVCSVAVSRDGQCLFSRINSEGMNHAALLSVFIKEAIETTGLRPDAIAVSCGPGSYTGLRIGVSTAKGLCYGYDIPLIAISTLEILTEGAKKMMKEIKHQALFCPMIDARRMEVYAAFYDIEGNIQREISADIIDDNSYREILEKQPVYFFGNGAAKCKEALSHSNALFFDDIVPLAENMITLGEKAYTEGKFVDVAYYEPFYLKEFQVTQKKS